MRLRVRLRLMFVYRLSFRQIDRDCEFLEQERIMDYSLLVGLHFRETSAAGDLIPSGSRTPTGFSPLFSSVHHLSLTKLWTVSLAGGPENEVAPRLSRVDLDQLFLDPSRWNINRSLLIANSLAFFFLNEVLVCTKPLNYNLDNFWFVDGRVSNWA